MRLNIPQLAASLMAGAKPIDGVLAKVCDLEAVALSLGCELMFERLITRFSVPADLFTVIDQSSLCHHITSADSTEGIQALLRWNVTDQLDRNTSNKVRFL